MLARVCCSWWAVLLELANMTCETVLGIPITDRFDKKHKLNVFYFICLILLKKHRLLHIVLKLNFCKVTVLRKFNFKHY